MPAHDDEHDEEGVRLIGPGPEAEAGGRAGSVWAQAGADDDDVHDLDDDPWAERPDEETGPPTGGVQQLGGGDRIELGAASGPVRLPSWTDPPTGQVPKVLQGDDDWSAKTGSQPRWRGEQDDWSEGDFDDALLDDGERMGALDSERDARSDLYSFEEELPSQPQQVVQIGGEGGAGASRAATASAAAAAAAGAGGAAAGSTTAAPSARRGRVATDDGGGGGRDFPMAIVVGGGLALVALLLFLAGGQLGPWVLATAIVMACAYELFDVFQRSGLRPATLLGLTATFALMWGVYARGLAAIPLVLFLALVGSMLWYLLKVIHARALLGVATTMLGITWVGVMGSFAALMLHGDGRGKPILLGAILVTVASDVAALAVGSFAGRTPLAPEASPHKTVEGSLGGLVAAIVVGVIVGFSSGVWGGAVHGFVLGLVGGVAAPIGDLSQSLIKRDLGVKDMGTALPGHGGFLDRFDSLLFVLPAVWFLAFRLNLVPFG